MSAPALSPSQLSPEVKGRRRPLGQPFRFASPPLPPLLDSASAAPLRTTRSFLSLDDSQSLTECGSVNSMKSYPHNLWATPSHADYPITPRRWPSVLSATEPPLQVKKRRRRLALPKERRTLTDQGARTRVELLKIKHQRRKWRKAWLSSASSCIQQGRLGLRVRTKLERRTSNEDGVEKTCATAVDHPKSGTGINY